MNSLSRIVSLLLLPGLTVPPLHSAAPFTASNPSFSHIFFDSQALTSPVLWMRNAKSVLGFQLRQEVAPRRGQSVTGYDGLTPKQAHDLALIMDRSTDQRPVPAQAEEVLILANEINDAVKNINNERSMLFRDVMGSSLWLRFYEAVDLLRNPTAVIEADGKSYRFEVRWVPGNTPFEFGEAKAWAFPVEVPPKAAGEPGRLIYYILRPSGTPLTDPLLVERVLHGILEYGVLPSVKELTPAQRHDAAYLMQGVIHGQLRVIEKTKIPILLPVQFFYELDVFVGLAQRWFTTDFRIRETDRIEASYPLRGSNLSVLIRQYLTNFVLYLSQEVNHQIIDVETPLDTPLVDEALAVPANMEIRYNRVVAIIGRMAKTGAVLVENPKRSKPDMLEVKDAMLAARQDILIPERVNRRWRLKWKEGTRLSRVGGPGHASIQYYEFSESISFRVEGHPFFLSVTPDAKGEIWFRFVSTENPDLVKYFPLGKNFTIGRDKGDYANPELQHLSERDFTVFISQADRGMFKIEVHAHSSHGLLVFENAPRTTDSERKDRYGQKAFGTEGLSLDQAARLAAVLESRKIFKPRLLSHDELRAAADGIEALVRNPNHEPSTIIRTRLGMSQWARYYHLIDLYRAPDTVLESDGIPYRFEVKVIPGREPLEFEGERVWSFANYTRALEKGMPGVMTLYIPDIDGFEEDPFLLDGLIHEGLEHLVFPLTPRLPQFLWHPLAVIMEAVAGGIVFLGESGLPAVITSRIHPELTLNPTHTTKLASNSQNYAQKDLIFKRFLPIENNPLHAALSRFHTDITEYVYQSARQALGLDREVPAKPAAIQATHPDRLIQKTAAKRFINERHDLGFHEFKVRDPEQNNEIRTFNYTDALVAADQGLLKLVVTPKESELQWSGSLRMLRLSGVNTMNQDVYFKEDVTFLVGDNHFKVWVDGEYLNSTPQIHFTLLGAGEDSRRPDLGKSYRVGRRFGDAKFPQAIGLEDTHFRFTVKRSPGVGFRLMLQSECQNGLLVVWAPPPTASSGSSSTANFLGLQTIYELLARFIRAAYQWIRENQHRREFTYDLFHYQELMRHRVKVNGRSYLFRSPQQSYLLAGNHPLAGKDAAILMMETYLATERKPLFVKVDPSPYRLDLGGEMLERLDLLLTVDTAKISTTREIVRRLQEPGTTVGIFPAGHPTSHLQEDLAQWKTGVAWASRLSRTPIVPFFMDIDANTQDYHLSFHPPVSPLLSTGELKTDQEILLELKNAVQALADFSAQQTVVSRSKDKDDIRTLWPGFWPFFHRVFRVRKLDSSRISSRAA